MSANVTKKRNIGEALVDETHADDSHKRLKIRDQAQCPINQLPSSSIHPPERAGSIFSVPSMLQAGSEDERNPEPYTYNPLRPNQIRLLRLHPGQRDDPIHCSLVTNSISAPLSYEALSYAWGEGHPAHHILLSDEEPNCSFTVPRGFKVTPNLFDALKHIRSSERPLILWIDSICINQEDTNEKNEQVRLMSEIFRNAQRVLVWLGNGTASTDWAVSNIRDIFGLDTSWNTDSDAPSERGSLPQERDTAWIEFANSCWFSRAWTVQEMSFAKQATFIRGSSEVDSQDFCMIVDLTLQHSSTGRDMALDPVLSDPSSQNLNLEPLRRAADFFRIASDSIEYSPDGLEVVGRKRSLFELITQTSNLRATDPRDKVYALLAMANQDSVVSPISADYNLSLPQICGRVVECEIEASQSLDVLIRPWAPRGTKSHNESSKRSDAEFVTWHAGQPSWICLAHDQSSESLQPRELRSSMVVGRAGPDLTGIAKSFSASKDYLPDVRFQSRVDSHFSLPQTRGSRGKGTHRESTATGDAGSAHNPRAIKNDVLVASGIEIGTITNVSSRMVGGNVSRDCLEMAGMSFSEGREALQNTSNKVWERLWRTLVADRNNDGLAAPTYFRLAFSKIFRQTLQLSGIDTDEMLATETDQNVLEFLSRLQDVTCNRRMFGSNMNDYGETLLGLAPRGARVGDKIVILFGCSVPIVIRTAGDVGKDYVTIVGEAYVHGKMHGEAFHGLSDETLREKTREFQIV